MRGLSAPTDPSHSGDCQCTPKGLGMLMTITQPRWGQGTAVTWGRGLGTIVTQGRGQGTAVIRGRDQGTAVIRGQGQGTEVTWAGSGHCSHLDRVRAPQSSGGRVRALKSPGRGQGTAVIWGWGQGTTVTRGHGRGTTVTQRWGQGTTVTQARGQGTAVTQGRGQGTAVTQGRGRAATRKSLVLFTVFYSLVLPRDSLPAHCFSAHWLSGRLHNFSVFHVANNFSFLFISMLCLLFSDSGRRLCFFGVCVKVPWQENMH